MSWDAETYMGWPKRVWEAKTRGGKPKRAVENQNARWEAKTRGGKPRRMVRSQNAWWGVPVSLHEYHGVGTHSGGFETVLGSPNKGWGDPDRWWEIATHCGRFKRVVGLGKGGG
jgi:hypothetical protein